MNCFVVDHTINRTTGGNGSRFGPMLLILAGGALIFSTVADYTTPLIQRKVSVGLWQLVTQGAIGAGWSIGVLAALLAAVRPMVQVTNLTSQAIKPPGYPKINNWVRYCGEGGWTILVVERLLADQHLWFCPAEGSVCQDHFSWPAWGDEPEGLKWQIALPLTRVGWDRLGRFKQLKLKRLKQRFFHS